MANTLKIVFVASGDPRLDSFKNIDSGGTGPIWRLASEFAERGHDVTIYSSTYNEYGSWKEANIDVIELPAINMSDKVDQVFHWIPPSRKVINFEQLSTTPGSMVERLLTRLLFSWRAANTISEDDPDVVYLRDRISAFFSVKQDFSSIFTVASPDACDFYYESSVSRHPLNRVLFKYKKWIEKFDLRNANSIVSINSGIKEYLESKGFNNIKIITLGIDREKFIDFTSRNEKPQVIYVGRFDGNKRPEWVLDAFKKIESDKFELHFIGSGPRQNMLERQTENLREEKKVIFHGHLPRQKVLDHMREAAVLVLPSEFESCSNVIIEAMASGCPVIASNTMGANELLIDGKTGILFKKNDKNTLRKELNRLLQNKEKREILAQEAYEYALEHHTTSVIANKYLEVGRRAIERSD